MKKILIILCFLLLYSISYSFEFNNVKAINILTPHLTYVAPTCMPNDYVSSYGDTTGVPAVGNQEDRNAYRGMYWTGETRKICGGTVDLTRHGNPDLYDWRISVWTVDTTNNLQLVEQLTSVVIPGSSIVTGFNSFTFPEMVTLNSGTTALLVSRADLGQSATDHLSMRIDWDEPDAESRQWASHYFSTGILAGRSPGDEDQPEYYAYTFTLNSYISVNPVNDFPNMPEDVETSVDSPTSILITWQERGQNQVTIDHYNVYLYDTNDASTVLVGSPTITSFTHTGLTSGTYTYVVTAVSNTGNESYHSLKNTASGIVGWQTTLP